MSLRSLIKPTSSLRASAQLQLKFNAARSISTSPRRSAAQGHDDHSHGHGQEAGDSDAYTNESFFTPVWRNTFILVTASILIYPYLPSPSSSTTSPSLDPETFSQIAKSKDSSIPWLTKKLADITPKAKVWTERNDKHLELTKEAAETKLLFQEAERPKVLRMRYPSAFEQASPHNIPVGSQADLTDLKVQY
ncbi:hypothetical protein IAT40_002567 [Kwoniella sp. CBS 6097]